MKFYIKSIGFIFFFAIGHFIHAQDETKIVRPKRNAFKIGITPIPTRIFFSYEHAFSKHFSLGAMASYGGTRFPGYTCNMFTRYYFKSFEQSSWFLEVRGGYAHYNPYVYTAIEYPNHPYDDNRDYVGKHRADIDYWSGGISGGYKAFFNERIFFEFLGGLHFGQATFGADDNYFARYGMSYELGSDKVEEVFNNSGPGNAFHFVLHFGYAF
ncbi:DUF3575 domain-containing protein [Cytophaga aurantiaca]|uniref:DUF3575 domain-containing protein n=1 Tax=Cytophaga aurantiaca TaxID=29530 RepID=UPI00037560BB|nr:DUF3575 domain-containing protein [Cytophaga aurantiaca]